MHPNPRISAYLTFAVTLAFAVCVLPISSSAESKTLRNRNAVKKALDFLRTDAAKWRKERECSTCHHGTMTVWALTEARSRGFEVPAEELAEILKWTKDRLLARIDLPRDTRPGWSMVNTAAIYLSLMERTLAERVMTEDELKRIAAHLLRHQELDGSWAWSSAPAQNRQPPFFESDEVATLLACASLGDSRKMTPEIRAARSRSMAWLEKAAPTGTTQAAAMKLLLEIRSGERSRRQDIDRLLERQNPDGGWPQVDGAPSDAYATGQSLYVLNLAGVKPNRREVQRGLDYLLATQKEDGSWPIAGRAHPGAHPSTNLAPITHLATAWATLALTRSLPRP